MNYIYKTNDEIKLYCWDSVKMDYVAVGPTEASVDTIDYIDGGNAFGPY
jgi:hypothetical protein